MVCQRQILKPTNDLSSFFLDISLTFLGKIEVLADFVVAKAGTPLTVEQARLCVYFSFFHVIVLFHFLIGKSILRQKIRSFFFFFILFDLFGRNYQIRKFLILELCWNATTMSMMIPLKNQSPIIQLKLSGAFTRFFFS